MASSPADVYEAQHLQDILARYPRTLSLLAQAVRKTDIAMKTHCYKIENNW